MGSCLEEVYSLVRKISICTQITTMWGKSDVSLQMGINCYNFRNNCRYTYQRKESLFLAGNTTGSFSQQGGTWSLVWWANWPKHHFCLTQVEKPGYYFLFLKLWSPHRAPWISSVQKRPLWKLVTILKGKKKKNTFGFKLIQFLRWTSIGRVERIHCFQPPGLRETGCVRPKIRAFVPRRKNCATQ